MEFNFPDPLTFSGSMSGSMYSPHKLGIPPRAMPNTVNNNVAIAKAAMAQSSPHPMQVAVKSKAASVPPPMADPRHKKNSAAGKPVKCQRKIWKKAVADSCTTLLYIIFFLVVLLAWIRWELHRESSLYEGIPPPDVESHGMCRRAVRDHTRAIDWPLARLYQAGIMSTPDAWCQKYHDIRVTPITPGVKRAAEKIVCEDLEKKMNKHHVNVLVIQDVFRGKFDGLLPKLDEIQDYWFQNETLKLMLYAAFAKHEGYTCKRLLGPVDQTEF